MVQDVRKWLLDDFLSRKITSNIKNLKTKKEDTIMKKNKMTITVLGCIGIFLIAALILVPAAQAGEMTVKYKIASSITNMEVFPVPDVQGHKVGVIEKRGVAIYENGETAAYHTRIIFDSIKGQGGSFWGYSDYTFADGSTNISKYQGTVTLPHEKLESFKAEGKYIKGTGRFEGIKGELSLTGKYITPYTKDKTKGDAVLEVTSTYTLPKK